MWQSKKITTNWPKDAVKKQAFKNSLYMSPIFLISYNILSLRGRERQGMGRGCFNIILQESILKSTNTSAFWLVFLLLVCNYTRVSGFPANKNVNYYNRNIKNM